MACTVARAKVEWVQTRVDEFQVSAIEMHNNLAQQVMIIEDMIVLLAQRLDELEDLSAKTEIKMKSTTGLTKVVSKAVDNLKISVDGVDSNTQALQQRLDNAVGVCKAEDTELEQRVHKRLPSPGTVERGAPGQVGSPRGRCDSGRFFHTVELCWTVRKNLPEVQGPHSDPS